ncbi:glycoside hydrolase family 3 N-terminal domain-containing protein [Nocardiopsis sp. N85]|uniref:glycoside hydrolase family 3 protein n=1 Tax=Nocardiopsis sp. N85 TaxID=3029400 RepID=UPI00237F222D|nr:glycoside hydrolase family 3 N-terminal domain-containing protein [Nocardiopsis sp. N85]MDE3721003.1 glycoside hydrolase family 3 N-terminal domain-containing protein [Nocardiopsis sp. N85]
MRTSLARALACAGLAMIVTACTTAPPEVDTSPREEPSPSPTTPPFEPVLAPRLLSEMDLDDKIGQLLVLTAQGTTAAENAALIETHRPGGLIYFDANLTDAAQIAELSNGVQELSPVPLFLGIDQEQGLVVRLPVGTRFPDAMAVGATRDTDLAALRATTTAIELAALGINLNYAPDADVNTDPNNPVIGIRSFGSEPDLVAEMAVAESEAYAEQGIVPVVKHFPGHGDTDVDSHTGLPVIDLPRDTWEAEHLPPFRAAVDAGVDAVMTAHVLMPQLDPDEPATLSSTIIGGILRDELGYEGVITTDALNMEGVRQRHSDGENAVLALEAGVDQLLMPPDPTAAVAAVKEAVETGRLTEERIDESALRVLALKEKRGVLEADPVDSAAAEEILTDPAHADAARRVADASVTLLRNTDDLLPLPPGTRVRVEGTNADRLGPALTDAGLDVVTGDADAVIVGTDTAPVHRSSAPTIAVSQGGPYVLGSSDTDAFVAVYSSVDVSLAAAARVIAGRIEPTGTLPVGIPETDATFGTGLTFEKD